MTAMKNVPHVSDTTITVRLTPEMYADLTRGMKPQDKSSFLWNYTNFARPYLAGDVVVVPSPSGRTHECTLQGAHMVCDPAYCPAAAAGTKCWAVYHAEFWFYFGRKHLPAAEDFTARYERSTGLDAVETLRTEAESLNEFRERRQVAERRRG